MKPTPITSNSTKKWQTANGAEAGWEAARKHQAAVDGDLFTTDDLPCWARVTQTLGWIGIYTNPLTALPALMASCDNPGAAPVSDEAESAEQDILNTTMEKQSIAAGGYHSCAIVKNDSLYCWGNNYEGQIGIGLWGERSYDEDEASALPTLVAQVSQPINVVAGEAHNCVIETDGNVSCWGRTWISNETSGVAVIPKRVNGVAEATGIDAGVNHVCAVMQSGGVRCWGRNEYGQLGVDGEATGLDAIAVPGMTDALKVAAGDGHSCAVRTSGMISCWGKVSGNFMLDGVVQDLRASGDNTCAVMESGAIYCWGSNDYGQLGDGTSVPITTPTAVVNMTDAASLSMGPSHSCAVTQHGAAFCWGQGWNGQLGNGKFAAMLIPTPVNDLSDVVAIAAGANHSCAEVAGGQFFCWGDNYQYALGTADIDDYETISTPIQVQLPE